MPGAHPPPCLGADIPHAWAGPHGHHNTCLGDKSLIPAGFIHDYCMLNAWVMYSECQWTPPGWLSFNHCMKNAWWRFDVWLMHFHPLFPPTQFTVPHTRAPKWPQAQERCGLRTLDQTCKKHSKYYRGKAYWATTCINSMCSNVLFTLQVECCFSPHGLANPCQDPCKRELVRWLEKRGAERGSSQHGTNAWQMTQGQGLIALPGTLVFWCASLEAYSGVAILQYEPSDSISGWAWASSASLDPPGSRVPSSKRKPCAFDVYIHVHII